MRTQRSAYLAMLTVALAVSGLAAQTQPAPALLPLVHTTWQAPKADKYTRALVAAGETQTFSDFKVTPATGAWAEGGPLGKHLTLKADERITVEAPAKWASKVLTVQAQVKAGDGAGVIFEMQPGGNAKDNTPRWTLSRDADGKLSLQAGGEKLEAGALPANAWQHVAVTIDANNVPMTIVKLRVDGREVGRVFPNFRLPMSGQRLVVGGGAALHVDGLELAEAARRTYAPVDQGHTGGAKQSERRGQPWFRGSATVAFAATFEEPIAGVAQGPGINGKAVLMNGRDAEMRTDIALPADLDMNSPGVLDFFIQPLDWDNRNNLPANTPPGAFVDRIVPVLKIIGKNAAGEEKVLARWQVDRGLNFLGELPDFHPGKWTHITLPWDGNAIRPYYDGKYVFGGNRRGVVYDKAALKTFKPVALRLESGRVSTLVDEITWYQGTLTSTEMTVAARRFDRTLEEPVALSVAPQVLLYYDAIRVGFTVNRGDYAKAATAAVRIYEAGGKQVVGEAATAIKPGLGSGTVIVPVRDYRDQASYDAEAVVMDAQGAVLHQARVPVPVYRPSWYKTTQGVMTKVPAPWTAIEAKAEQVSCWSSVYKVGDDGLLTSVRTCGEEMLARPMQLAAENAAGKVAFTAKRSAIAVDPVSAQWSAMLNSPQVDVRVAARMEFDGMIKYVLTLTPKGKATLSNMTLDVPLQNRLAPLHHAISLGSEGSSAGALAAGEGRVWDSASAYQGKNGSLPPASGSFAGTPSTRWKNPLAVGSFLPMLWVGSEERGFCWFADNDRGWTPTNNTPAIELLREKDTLTLRLNLISETLEFDQPRTITFGVIPTPTKPLAADARAWHRGGTATNKGMGNIGGAFDSHWGPVVGDPFGIFPLHGWDLAQSAGKTMKGFGKTRVLYMSAYWMNERLEDWYKHAWEWEGTNGGRATFTPSYVDYLASEFGQWFDRDILDGVYIDEVYPTWDSRVESGSGYLLPNGKVQPSTSLFQEREFFKRLWGVSVANGKQPLIIQHMTGTMVPPLVSFASVTLDGEGHWIKKGGKDFMDCWPLERIRAMNLGAGGGNYPLWIPMLAEDSEAFKTDLAWRRNATRNTLGVLLLHDVWLMFDRADSPFIYRFTGPALRSFDIAEPDIVFTGYWQNNAVARTATDDVRISTYHKEGKALLIVTNFKREAATVDVKVDLKALKLEAATAADLEARYHAGMKDTKFSFTPGAAPTMQNDTVQVPVEARDYRLIVIEKK